MYSNFLGVRATDSGFVVYLITSHRDTQLTRPIDALCDAVAVRSLLIDELDEQLTVDQLRFLGAHAVRENELELRVAAAEHALAWAESEYRSPCSAHHERLLAAHRADLQIARAALALGPTVERPRAAQQLVQVLA